MITFCSLFSGSSGNCIYIASDQARLLIDCGVSGKKIAASLMSIEVDPTQIDGILVTHEHKDHSHALGIMSRRYGIPIYANERTWDSLKHEVGAVKQENMKIIEESGYFHIKDIAIRAFPIPHDAVEPVGYCFHVDGKKVSVATDIGYVDDSLISCLEGSDIILIESNHDIDMLKCGSYPYYLKQRILGSHGHLSNEAAGELVTHLAGKGTKRFLLGHLSKENNFPQLAYQTVYNALASRNIKAGHDVSLEVAGRENTSSVYKL